MNLTDDTGAVTATYSQDAFGNVLSGSSDGFHLTTKDYNNDIGLYYFAERWYMSEVGRFTQRSSFDVWFEHPYLYVESNPVIYVDPTGLFCYSRSKKSKLLSTTYNPWQRDNRRWNLKGPNDNVDIVDPFPPIYVGAICRWYFKRMIVKRFLVTITYDCWEPCKGFYSYATQDEEVDVKWEREAIETRARLWPMGPYSRMAWLCLSSDLPEQWQKVQGQADY